MNQKKGVIPTGYDIMSEAKKLSPGICRNKALRLFESV